jgi:hypothetical protein
MNTNYITLLLVTLIGISALMYAYSMLIYIEYWYLIPMYILVEIMLFIAIYVLFRDGWDYDRGLKL